MFLCVVASSPELPTPTSPTTKTTKNEKFPHLLSHTQKSGKTHDDDNNNNEGNAEPSYSNENFSFKIQMRDAVSWSSLT